MNTIHPSAVIGDGVVLGRDNVIGPHAVLLGPLVIGDGNWFGPGVVLGTPPEVRSFDHVAGRPAGLVIGSRNVVREFATIHQGWQATTTVGDDCFLMNKVYIGHDGCIEDRVTMAAGVNLGGHVTVGVDANLGLGAQVHQRRIIGPGAMVGMGSVVTRDVLPFAKSFGNPARLASSNVHRLRLLGWPETSVAEVEARYRRIAAGGLAEDDMAGMPVEFSDALHWWQSRHP